MKLSHILEQVEERSRVKMLSDFITTVNDLADLFNQQPSPKDMMSQLSTYVPRIDYYKSKIGQTTIPDDEWSTMKTESSPKSWKEFRGGMTTALGRLSQSLRDLIQEPLSQNGELKFTIAKDKINTIRDSVTGMAPNVMPQPPDIDKIEQQPS